MMTDYKAIKNIVDTLNKVTLDKDSFNTLCKDRLDFGFDSIYFRYAMIRDELAYYKAKDSHNIDQEKRRAENDKMRFYCTLEQLTHAHKEGGASCDSH